MSLDYNRTQEQSNKLKLTKFNNKSTRSLQITCLLLLLDSHASGKDIPTNMHAMRGEFPSLQTWIGHS